MDYDLLLKKELQVLDKETTCSVAHRVVFGVPLLQCGRLTKIALIITTKEDPLPIVSSNSSREGVPTIEEG